MAASHMNAGCCSKVHGHSTWITNSMHFCSGEIILQHSHSISVNLSNLSFQNHPESGPSIWGQSVLVDHHHLLIQVRQHETWSLSWNPAELAMHLQLATFRNWWMLCSHSMRSAMNMVTACSLSGAAPNSRLHSSLLGTMLAGVVLIVSSMDTLKTSHKTVPSHPNLSGTLNWPSSGISLLSLHGITPSCPNGCGEVAHILHTPRHWHILQESWLKVLASITVQLVTRISATTDVSWLGMVYSCGHLVK